MYNYQIKRKTIYALGIGIILGCSNVLFGFDLGEEIYDRFKSVYDKGISNDYLDSAYKSEYPADPFWDNFNNLDGMQKQVKVAGAQYIEDELRVNNCSLSKKEIWGILYYFVPEFRAEMARDLKRQGGYKNSKKLAFDKTTVEKYCKKYFDCAQKMNGGSNQNYGISASTSNNVMTNCKRYFQNAYAKGSDNEKQMQSVMDSRAGNDKFWNATIDDSPYDIMLDLNGIGILLFEDSTEPMTPVFYNLPVFSNSAQSLLNNINSNHGGGGNGGNNAGTGAGGRGNNPGGNGGNNVGISAGGRGNNPGGNGGNSVGTSAGGRGDNPGGIGGNNVGQKAGGNVLGSTVDNVSLVNNNSLEDFGSRDTSQNSVKDSVNLGNENKVGGQKSDDSMNKTESDKSKGENGIVESLEGSGLSSEFIEDAYDELVDGLGTTSLVDKGTLFYGSLCKDNEVESEPEGNIVNVSVGGTSTVVVDGGNDSQILSEEEYQEIVDYMLFAVEQYVVLPEDVQANVMEFVASLDSVDPEGGYNAPATPDTSDEAVNQIKSCVESCNGLRADQYISCVEMCACGEWTSPIFDPEGNSGLGPIAKVRFCTVPGRDMKFSEGGRNIISIEEGGKEILGVVDKLSREGKLGIWTKQTSFLDSSTKELKIGKIISFSIDVQGVDIGEKPGESSKQYEEMILKNNNETLQKMYGISCPLNDSSCKNQYNISGGNVKVDSQADRYVRTSEILNTYLEQQSTLWKQMLKSMEELTKRATELSNKKS